jgi:ribosomal protein S12 methylthiotransferase accessory factor YcaO
VSAIMEAAECWHGENTDLLLRLACYSELVARFRAADPERLPRNGYLDLGATAFSQTRLLWTQGVDLISGEPIWVPYELVSTDYTEPQPPGFGFFQATTNGLGAGNSMAEAILHGVCEVIERDAVTLWHVSSERSRAAHAIDPETVDGPASAALLARFCGSLVTNRDDQEGVEPELGSGCHPDPDVALARALAECAQARLTRISGARDDFPPESYDRTARLHRHELAAQCLGVKPTSDFRRRTGCAVSTVQGDIEAVLRCLERAGFGQVILVDLGRPNVGLAVARLIVTGLEGPWEPDGPHLPGQRARAAA